MARLSYVDGSVSFRPGDLDDWAPASRNRPLTTGDRLWTDRSSRAELQLGRTSVRIGPETAFGFLNLSDDVAQMEVTQGSLRVHVRGFSEGDALEVDTPNTAVSLLRPGVYRLDVDANGDTTVTVRRGEATVTAEGSEVTVHEREVGSFRGTQNTSYDIESAEAGDDWDRWCAERERWDDEARAASRYVSPEMVGWEDLDDYGRWRDVPDYGMVWVPSRVSTSWAPYRMGHWGYVAPWGWTWIDDEPWGFAPFHYGRWARFAGEWVWIPGRRVPHVRPVYAPALVAFVGGGSWSASLSIGAGGVAWFPLGPREVFYPPYTVSRVYVQNVNVTQVNVVNVNRDGRNVRYLNQSIPGAVTAVPRAAFVSAQAVAAVAVPVPPRALAAVRPGPALLGVPPTPQSVLSHAVLPPSAVIARPPLPLVSRAVVARLTPPPPPVALGLTSHTAARVSAPTFKPAIPPIGSSVVALRPARPSLEAARIVRQSSVSSAHVSPSSLGGTAHSSVSGGNVGSQWGGAQSTGGAVGSSQSMGGSQSTGTGAHERRVINDRPSHAFGSGTPSGSASGASGATGSGASTGAASSSAGASHHSATSHLQAGGAAQGSGHAAGTAGSGGSVSPGTGSALHATSGSTHTTGSGSSHTDSATVHGGSGSQVSHAPTGANATGNARTLAATPHPTPHPTVRPTPHPTPRPTPTPHPTPPPHPKKHQ